EQRTSLTPIAEDHHGERACFRPGRRDSHRLVKAVRKVILEKPISRLPQSGLAPHVIDLQVQLCLFVGWFLCHSFFGLHFWSLLWTLSPDTVQPAARLILLLAHHLAGNAPSGI